MARKLVMGNWKMNGSSAQISEMIAGLANQAFAAQLVLALPAPYLASARCEAPDWLAIGAQDCSGRASGAYTGEVSASMLVDVGCSYVILGHSERRQLFGESDQLILTKFQRALDVGLTPVVCVGETLSERQSGLAKSVVAEQLANIKSVCSSVSGFLIAYEPVWAIGTGAVPELSDIQAMHVHIKSLVQEDVRVLYGGSVKSSNAAAVLSIGSVDGLLVGGACLSVGEFSQICHLASE